LPGSRLNCSYISSTSHSLAPKSEDGAEAGSDGLVCCCGTGLDRLFRDVRVGGRDSAVQASPPRTEIPKYGGPLVHGVSRHHDRSPSPGAGAPPDRRDGTPQRPERTRGLPPFQPPYQPPTQPPSQPARSAATGRSRTTSAAVLVTLLLAVTLATGGCSSSD